MSSDTLSDDALREIEARLKSWAAHEIPHTQYPASWSEVDALCATVRALRQQIAELTAEWCECGHAKTQHGFFSDHDECYECDQMSDDLCCHWRPVPRATDTHTALREQLAQRDKVGTYESVLEALQCLITAGLDKEDEPNTLLAMVKAVVAQRDELKDQLAQVTQERQLCLQVQKRGIHSSVTCPCVAAMEASHEQPQH